MMIGFVVVLEESFVEVVLNFEDVSIEFLIFNTWGLKVGIYACDSEFLKSFEDDLVLIVEHAL